jgi:UDP-N-acetylglucosamine 2-epimerase (non-hydrolysing)
MPTAHTFSEAAAPAVLHHAPRTAPRTFLTCLGTRPEIIKMAPVYKALQAQGDRVLIIHTGQHEAVAHELYRFFDMPPDIVIDLQRKSTSLAHLTSALTDGVEAAMKTLAPDVVMIQGDTTSALIGALVGYYHDKPVAHIEAGLRTHQRDPFPEEKNRELIGRLAHWHFPPTPQARNNLLAESVPAERIFEVGNTVIDAALWTRDRLQAGYAQANPSMPALAREFLQRFADHQLILITAHRRENWGEPIRHIARAAAKILADHPATVVVWPVHPNPAVRKDVEDELGNLPAAIQQRICLTAPLDYPALIELLVRCHFTLTDSGGIQEEASAFAKPVLVARDSTERQELVDVGGAHLVGTNIDTIVRHAESLLTDEMAYRRMQVECSPFGDGKSSQRIATILSPATDGVSRVQ